MLLSRIIKKSENSVERIKFVISLKFCEQGIHCLSCSLQMTSYMFGRNTYDVILISK